MTQSKLFTAAIRLLRESPSFPECLRGNVMNTILEHYSDLDLLRELLRRRELTPTPTTVERSYLHTAKSCIIGIGPDHVAEIIICQDDLEELMKHKHL